MSVKASYYQFHPKLNYQVYLRLEDEELENELAPLFERLGFSKLPEEELKIIPFQKNATKVLKLSAAGPRVAKLIQNFSNGMENYGCESLTSQGGYQVYRYRNTGMMIFSDKIPTWEMGVVRARQNRETIKAMLARFVSWALASKGVVGFWAAPVEQGFVVMKPVESNFESVFLDIDQMALITEEGVKKITHHLQILRLDTTLKNATKKMSREGFLSFLCSNTCHFSYEGLPPAMSKNLVEISSFAQGVIYPVENFQPRMDFAID